MPSMLSWLVSLMLLALAACGGGDRPAGESGLRDAGAVAAQALDRFEGNPGEAAVAILTAADRGYSLRQIVQAIETGTLTAAGGIITDGTVVEPARTATDFIADKPPIEPGHALRLVAAVSQDEPVTHNHLKQTFEPDLLAALDKAKSQAVSGGSRRLGSGGRPVGARPRDDAHLV